MRKGTDGERGRETLYPFNRVIIRLRVFFSLFHSALIDLPFASVAMENVVISLIAFKCNRFAFKAIVLKRKRFQVSTFISERFH